jgi:hypothetical protein
MSAASPTGRLPSGTWTHDRDQCEGNGWTRSFESGCRRSSVTVGLGGVWPSAGVLETQKETAERRWGRCVAVAVSKVSSTQREIEDYSALVGDANTAAPAAIRRLNCRGMSATEERAVGQRTDYRCRLPRRCLPAVVDEPAPPDDADRGRGLCSSESWAVCRQWWIWPRTVERVCDNASTGRPCLCY